MAPIAVFIINREKGNAEIIVPRPIDGGVLRREELLTASIEISEREIESMLRSLDDVVMLRDIEQFIEQIIVADLGGEKIDGAVSIKISGAVPCENNAV